MKRQHDDDDEQNQSKTQSLYDLPPELLCMVVRKLDDVSRVVFYFVAHTTRRGFVTPPKKMDTLCNMAARQGHGALVQWATALGYDAGDVLKHAVRGGHLSLAITLCDNDSDRGDGIPPPGDVYIRCAARSGNQALLRWVIGPRELDLYPRIALLKGAAKYGHTHILQRYLIQHEEVASAMYCAAVRANQVAVLAWLALHYRHYVSDSKVLFAIAVNGGAREALEWMVASWPGVMSLSGWCCRAVSRKQFHLVQWLREQGSEWCPCVVNRAAHYDLPPLDWLMEQGAPCNADTAYKLAKHQRDTHLKKFVEKGGAMDERVTEVVARAGKLDLLQWLRAHNCPWDDGVRVGAEANGHDAVVEWAAAHGCPSTRAARPPKIGERVLGQIAQMGVVGGVLAALFAGGAHRAQ